MARRPYSRRRERTWKPVAFGAGLSALLAMLAAALLKPEATPIDRARSARLLGQMEASQKQADRERAAAEAARRAGLF